MESQFTNIDPLTFRAALRQWASGVTVVTCEDRGFQHGMTVSSFLSVSLTPPLLLVSLQNGTRTLEMIKHAKTFSVNILHQEQKELADLFAGRKEDHGNRFSNLETLTLQSQSPLLKGSLACFDCLVQSLQEVSDHTLVIGEVIAVAVADEQAPLVYFQRNYHTL
ncbi:MAG TPA: flavin reductase family protein [Anaerolineales bacterium]|nr:flavin reductase family protein [Anaerolineales bacterium]